MPWVIAFYTQIYYTRLCIKFKFVDTKHRNKDIKNNLICKQICQNSTIICPSKCLYDLCATNSPP